MTVDQKRRSRNRQLAVELERAKGERVLRELGELGELVETIVRVKSERPRAIKTESGGSASR